MNEKVNDRNQEIDGFVTRLVQIRSKAGDPSFRVMARRSGAISHTTLHDAVQGTRLPSWETVVEFAKACDVRPESLREHWTRAETALNSLDSAASVQLSTDEPLPGSTAPESESETPASSAEALPDHPSPTRNRFGIPALVTSAVLGAGLMFVATSIREPRATGQANYVQTPAAATVQATPGCATNPGEWPKQPPRLPGDGAMLVADISLPDCSEQPLNATLTKTWRIKNNGALPWQGRHLRRIDPLMGPGSCSAPELAVIPNAAPGQEVDVSVEVRTPAQETSCFTRWMVVDNDGHYAFPGQRPFFFSFFVK